jgi:hypothetical protein
VVDRFGFSWADAQTLRLWEFAALLNQMDTESKRRKNAEQAAKRRR